jgi:hypothetical protein
MSWIRCNRTVPAPSSLGTIIEQLVRISVTSVEMTTNNDADADRILAQFDLFSGEVGGLGSLFRKTSCPEVLQRLDTISAQPLSRTQLNQLLHLSNEAGVSEGFFKYYWLTAPRHSYDVTGIPGYQSKWSTAEAIESLGHLHWGTYRVCLDALFYFGDLRAGYRELRTRSDTQLAEFFRSERIDSDAIKRRGPALPMVPITRDDRYLISEMACKSYGDPAKGRGDLRATLQGALDAHLRGGGGRITIRKLLEQGCMEAAVAARQTEFLFSADDILDKEVGTTEQLELHYAEVLQKFSKAREAALDNTRLYLSIVNDLDVYVATSMRDRDDFRKMADFCNVVFSAPQLADLSLRYFDPTLSAAEGHEDKGLIECLMVKCAKVLIYCAGKKESYGKDAEAAMALSLGKPVIFYCDEEQKGRFYREVHPLSRLIEFSTGVAVGAIITCSVKEVIQLLQQLFDNKMQYTLEQHKADYYRIKEKITGSVVRLQTSDKLLRETFWNYYHNRT